MVLIIDIDYGIKEPTMGIKFLIPVKLLIFHGYVKVRKPLCTRVLIWVNTILNHFNHIGTRPMLPRYIE
jgi:hypothetical protein